MNNFKKFAFMSLFLFIITIITSACGSGGSSGTCDYFPLPIISKEIKLSKYSFDMKIGETEQIIAYVDGEDKTNEVKFTIVSEKNNKSTVVTIEKGKITAVNSGTAKVKVSYEGANDVTFTVKVTDLPELQLSKDNFTINVGSTDKITVTLDGKDVTNSVEYDIEYENIASVENGVITGLKAGTTRVNVHHDQAKEDKIFTVKVIDLPDLVLSQDKFSINIGSTDKITVTLDGKDVTNSVIYTPEDTEIATIENGVITAIKAGTTKVNVHHDGAKEDKTFVVTSIDPTLPNLELSSDNFNITMGETDEVTVKLNGKTVTDTVEYDVDNEEIATVDKGTITAIKTGKAFVTVKYEGANDATFTVNVTGRLTVLNNEGQLIETLDINLKHTDNVVVMLDNKYIVTEDVEYIVDDEDIITVDKGNITTKKAGTATVTVHLDGTEEDTEFTVNVIGELKVYKDDTEVSNPLNINLRHNDQVVVKLNDTDIVTEDVEYIVDDEDIITVDKGNITTKKTGTATVTVHLDGCESDVTFDVNVIGVLKVYKGDTEVPNPLNINLRHSDQIVVKLNDIDIVTEDVTFAPETEGIITIANDGTITTTKSGTTAVNVTLEGVEDSTSFNVKVNGVLTLSSTSFNLLIEETANITVTLNGDDIVTDDVKFTSANPVLVEVENGLITAGVEGVENLEINVHLDGAEEDATFTVTVTDDVLPANCVQLTDAILTEIGINKTDANIVIPATYTYNGTKKKVTSIKNNLFENSRTLESVSIPKSVKTIGTRAFAGCANLETAIIENGVETIGESAFANCTSLANLTIGDSVTTIGVKAFIHCSSLTEIPIPKNIETIGKSAFEGTSITQVTIPAIKTLSFGIFKQCKSLTEITIPEGVEEIGEQAFGECTALTKVTIPNSVKTIGVQAFNTLDGNNTSLQTVTFGENSQLETIGNLAFGNNKNANLAITIPDSVTSIGRRSFNDVENIYYSDVIKTRFSGADGFPHFGAHNYNDTPRENNL